MTANQNPTQLEQLLFSLLNPSSQQNGISLPSNGNGNGMQLPTNALLQLGGLLNQQQQLQQQPQLPSGQVDLRNLATAVGNFAQQPAGGQQQQQQQQQQQHLQQQYFKQAPPPAPPAATTTTTTPPASITEKKDNGEDEKALSPGTRMIPCRARRMPSAHNLLNAYFQVPENVKHGEDLVCSFPACRNAGVKFRYCIHCKAPVAKRNFAKRHTHAHGAGVPLDSSMSKEDMDDEDDKEDESKESKESKQSVQQRNNHQATSKKKKKSSDTIVTDKSSAGGNSGGVSSGNSATSFNNKKRSSESPNKSNSAAKKAPNPPMLDEKRIQRWSELLANRPDTMDEHGMTLWIEEVMAVSDFRKSYLPEATFRARFSNESTNQLMKESSKPLKKRKRSKSKQSSSESRHSKKPASLKSNAPEGEKPSLKEAPEEQQQQEIPSSAVSQNLKKNESDASKDEKKGEEGTGWI